jgi:hypothetical protein
MRIARIILVAAALSGCEAIAFGAPTFTPAPLALAFDPPAADPIEIVDGAYLPGFDAADFSDETPLVSDDTDTFDPAGYLLSW